VPENVVRAVDARGYWHGIAALEAVVEVPILRADGSVLETPGYDESTGIYFYKGGGVFPPVPERPTREDAIAALARLLDVLADFPFVDESHRAAAVVVILTPFGRFTFDGCVPFALYEANTPGAGKGLLSEVSATIWSKTGIPRMALPTRDEEFQKQITSLLIAGDMLVNWDNIRGPLGGPALEAVLTSRVWKDRILGVSKMTGNLSVNLIHTGTANNAVLIGDMPRRVLGIRLEVEQENAEERSGWRHPELLAHVRQHRGELAVAAVTILRAYVCAGKRSQKLPPWGSFAEWSALIRSAVVWAGMEDPAKTRIELRDRADTEATTLRQLLAGWEELDADGNGLTVVEAITLLDGYPNQYAAAREAMAELFGHTKAKPASTKAIGKRLSGFRRRVANGRRFDFREDRNGTKHWFVDVAAGYEGFAGCSHNPPRAHTHAHAHAHTNECVEQQTLLDNADKIPTAVTIIATNAGFDPSWQLQWHNLASSSDRWHFSAYTQPAPWIDPADLAESQRRNSQARFNRLWRGQWVREEGIQVDDAIDFDSPAGVNALLAALKTKVASVKAAAAKRSKGGKNPDLPDDHPGLDMSRAARDREFQTGCRI
jgi:hypothetical protein